MGRAFRPAGAWAPASSSPRVPSAYSLFTGHRNSVTALLVEELYIIITNLLFR